MKRRTIEENDQKFALRMPPALHAKLVKAAKETNVSMNRYVNQAIEEQVRERRFTLKSLIQRMEKKNII